MTYKIHNANCLDVLREMSDNSVDSIVTDPPYGLSFMGKKWDYDVPSVEIWAECLRVLKPGGHLLAFAGTRTQHRMAVRIEDAGFEIRDMIAWVYGSGFPKSLDVSKAIDKVDATEVRRERRHKFCDWFKCLGHDQPFWRDVLMNSGIFSTRESCSTQASSYLNHAKQGPAIPTRHVFEMLRPHFGGVVPAWVEQLVDERTVESENFKRREVVATTVMTDTRIARPACAFSAQGINAAPSREVAITTAHTDAARQWEGWGTALKPALEPITVARKPLAGTVAANVLAHGTGALNIDGCRAGDEVTVTIGSAAVGTAAFGDYTGMEPRANPPGRWPANLIHDGSDEVVALFPAKAGAASPVKGTEASRASDGGITGERQRVAGAFHDDTGSAARFFYCAKASKKDRGTGNNHPTVKPTDLMRYLCRLVTPPGGTVLDPFTGSGSTGKAAMLEGLRFIGCEMSAEYAAIAEARISAAFDAWLCGS